jgi:hypothetical protein
MVQEVLIAGWRYEATPLSYSRTQASSIHIQLRLMDGVFKMQHEPVVGGSRCECGQAATFTVRTYSSKTQVGTETKYGHIPLRNRPIMWATCDGHLARDIRRSLERARMKGYAWRNPVVTIRQEIM